MAADPRYDDVPGHPLEGVDWRAADLVRRALAEALPGYCDVRGADLEPLVVHVLAPLHRVGLLRRPGAADPALADLIAYVGAEPALVFYQHHPAAAPTALDLAGEGYSEGDYAELDLSDREVVVAEALVRLAHRRVVEVARKRGLS